uniref:H-type lectin domain-containing protein n=1 Tax=Candidatus Kentrum sp. TUN TaxID=2126343 RepID=A0A451A7H0_9GAMM|nr:MAG: H-type lectin domain-containing protein [Candidatus Kentron sp. TUN]VFK70515.1 MAG: H-type lectin domain-containing protein [Candidatus Kentron sp. TUN]
MGINTSSPTTLLEVNGSSKLGGAGTPFNAMQLGKVDVLGGSGGQDRVIVPVTFPKPFADNPIIIATVAAPPGISYGDAFNVTAENITSTGFDAVVKGLPIPGNQGSWGADLQVHWQVYEL